MSIVGGIVGVFSGNSYLIIIVILAIICFLAFMYITNLQKKIETLLKYNNFIDIFAKASKDKKSIGILVDRTEKMIPFINEQDPKNKGLISNEKNLVIVNPELTKKSSTVAHFDGCPDMYFYPVQYGFSTTFHTSAALVQVVEKIRENAELNWLPNEKDVIALVFDSTGDLFEDCCTMVGQAVQFRANIPDFLLDSELFEDVDDYEELSDIHYQYLGKKLTSAVMKFRDEINYIPIKSEPVCLSEAANLCSIGSNANDIKHLMTILEDAIKAEVLGIFDKYKDYFIIALVVCMIPLLYYIVMSFSKGV